MRNVAVVSALLIVVVALPGGEAGPLPVIHAAVGEITGYETYEFQVGPYCVQVPPSGVPQAASCTGPPEPWCSLLGDVQLLCGA